MMTADEEQLRERLFAKIDNAGVGLCHKWTAAVSQSGYRGVFYPALWWKKRTWRVNRLLLILERGPAEVIHDGIESFDEWLERARKYYEGFDASHNCDQSLCANIEHLEWETHAENVKRQAERRREGIRPGAFKRRRN